MNDINDEGQELEAKERTPEDVERKLLKLVNDSPTFEVFRQRIESFMKFYLGSPVPEPYRTWGWSQYQEFYLTHKQ